MVNKQFKVTRKYTVPAYCEDTQILMAENEEQAIELAKKEKDWDIPDIEHDFQMAESFEYEAETW